MPGLIGASLIVAGPANGQAVVQPIPGPEADRLAEAMRVLAQQPEDLSALLQAGDAALYLGDLTAAQNFYARARDVAPQDGRVAAGHAVLLLRQDQPVEALGAFDVAAAAGIDMTPYAADRGLAYDLVGNGAAAQAEYRRALATGPDDTVTLRLAISQAIAGDRAGFEATLLPLLQQGDLSAFRMRAFALAINGQQDEAVSIAQTMLPERLSSRLAPYLRYMPRLTRAQQAAAAHLGRFPQAQQIGQDDPAIAGLSQQRPAQPVVQPTTPPPRPPAEAPPQVAQAQIGVIPPLRTADARLAPTGAVLGSAEPQPATAFAEPVVQQIPQQVEPQDMTVSGELPPAGQAAPAPSQPAVQAEAAPQHDPLPAPVQQPVVPQLPVEQPVGQILPPSQPVVVSVADPQPMADPAPIPTPIDQLVETPVPASLAEAFATFVQPAAMPDPLAAGGVDITTIAPPRERPKPPPPPPPPPAPPPLASREWVQLATGRDIAALAFDWRRIQRAAGDLLKKAEPHLAEWDGRTRLLAGPYSASQAETLVNSLKEAGVDSFRFTSAQGEDVRALD